MSLDRIETPFNLMANQREMKATKSDIDQSFFKSNDIESAAVQRIERNRMVKLAMAKELLNLGFTLPAIERILHLKKNDLLDI